jgi:16S rRNA (adenine1518-N6/adenine1519-N6)-dimethyltransferase
VSRQVFWPVPNVDSVLVGFHRDPEPRGDEDPPPTFHRGAAFGQRRKMLRQALSEVLGVRGIRERHPRERGVDPRRAASS